MSLYSDMIFKKELILYHGSRGGIEGDIRPISRERCDFGRGFYMGDNPMQTKGLVIDQDPVFYELKLDLNKIPQNRILELSGKQWLYAVIASRNSIPEFTALKESQRILDKINKAWLVCGHIADDRMNEAVRAFEHYALTDKGLEECLKSVDYGNQYVLKNENVCNAVNILSSHEIYDRNEVEQIRSYAEQKRSESIGIVQQIQKQYKREGLYLDEIIDAEKTKELVSDRYPETDKGIKKDKGRTNGDGR